MDKARSRIILVDDSIPNLDQGRSMLRTFYEVFPALSAEILFEILENVIPDLILLDIEMPVMNGYETIKKLKSDPRYADIPVIFLTARDDEDSEMQGFDLGAADYITKPFSGPLLLKRIANQLLIERQKRSLQEAHAELKTYADNLEIRIKEKTAEVTNLQNAIVATVANLVEFRDKLTGGHIAYTSRYLQAIIDEMILDGTYTDEISKWNMGIFLPAAQLHDVGKIAITDLILNKPAKLTKAEFDIMKTHVTVGVDAIEQIMSKTKKNAFLNHALLITGTHHEKWDGSGYPIGLTGYNIPLEGRLMTVADVYDALISERPYKKAFSHKEACRIIEDGSGSNFDPKVIEAFKMAEGKFEEISRKTM